MQALEAAGLPVLGEKFPQDWHRYEAANPRGYYESPFTEGIHSRTNTSRLTPEQTRGTAVKVFLRGLPLSQRAFLESVIITVRHPGAYAASLHRARAVFGQPPPQPDEPFLKWWLEHWMVLEDVMMRGYRCRFVSYESARQRPSEVLPPVLSWLGIPCDREAAVSAIVQVPPEPLPELPPAWAPAFEELYGRVCRGETLDDKFLSRWRSFHLQLTELARSRGGILLDRWGAIIRPN